MEVLGACRRDRRQVLSGGLWYQQGVAIAMVRENAETDLPLAPKDSI